MNGGFMGVELKKHLDFSLWSISKFNREIGGFNQEIWRLMGGLMGIYLEILSIKFV